MEDAHYMMSKCQALELALHNEVRGRDFYAEVAAKSPDAEVRQVAEEMAAEEDTHVKMLPAASGAPGTMHRLVLGSVSQAVIHRSERPVRFVFRSVLRRSRRRTRRRPTVTSHRLQAAQDCI